jgi:hypothetical protein
MRAAAAGASWLLLDRDACRQPAIRLPGTAAVIVPLQALDVPNSDVQGKNLRA